MPFRHVEHAVEFHAAYEPAVHCVHADEPAATLVAKPAEQPLHTTVPGESENVPDAHGGQAAAFGVPDATAYEPAGHGSHTRRFASENVPGPQMPHAVTPAEEDTKPGLHGSHDVAPCVTPV